MNFLIGVLTELCLCTLLLLNANQFKTDLSSNTRKVNVGGMDFKSKSQDLEAVKEQGAASLAVTAKSS